MWKENGTCGHAAGRVLEEEWRSRGLSLGMEQVERSPS